MLPDLDRLEMPRALQNLYSSRDAELRIMYTAVTRTKHGLHLIGDHPLVSA